MEKTKLIGVILMCFAILSSGKNALADIKIIGLTPEKCTQATEGTIVDTVYGTKMQYGGSVRGNMYDVYYDVIEYKVDNQIYKITSRHASTGDPVIGATTTVNYNPDNPAKAYDNSPPYLDASDYYYSVMIFIIGLALVLGLDKLLKKKNE